MSSIIRKSALNLLAMREHTKIELQRKLIAKGFVANDVAKVIQELENQGLQSDQRFVESYVAIRCRRGFGPVRIKAELYERGVAQELIEEFQRNYKSTWLELAQKLRFKKFGEEIPKDLYNRNKQMQYLYNKGYDVDLIRKIFKE